MKASELRIGNWVVNSTYPEDECIVKVDSIRDLYDEHSLSEINMHHPNDIHPIPLTEEWLLKFGFEDDSYAVFRKVIDKGISISVSFQDYAHTMLCDHPVTIWPNDYSIPIKCQYVHQLQNLYFAFTGEELEVK